MDFTIDPPSASHRLPLHETAAQWRALAAERRPPAPARGLDALWVAAEGRIRTLAPTRLRCMRRARRIAAWQEQDAELSDRRLLEMLRSFRELFCLGRGGPADTERAMALVAEVAARRIGLRPHTVQLAGALALLGGCVAEMATGEGKTLTAALAAVIAGWRGRGCHVITVNDYLARRDARWMGPIYECCGLSVAHVEQAMGREQRRDAYTADVTYATNKEVTADYLRDRLTIGPSRSLTRRLVQRLTGHGSADAARPVMRGLAFAIVDEADSVLIDEAVTPLIISGQAPNAEQAEAFERAGDLAGQMEAPAHYRVDHRWREVGLTAAGRRRLDELCEGLGGLWAGPRRREELVTQALTARELYQAGRQYVVREGKIVIVDEFTGRLMPDRTWRDGLHQAVEAKEGLEVQPPKQTLARISFQRFFRLYRRLSGMSGTAAEARAELWRTYRLPVVRLPTHRPCIRRTAPDQLHATAERRWAAVIAEVRRVHAKGQPVLIGTRSVEASEHLSRLLGEAGLEHRVLNAVRHEQEAAVIAEAGRRGRITVATNMAGRGTDIRLGEGVGELGGLHVVATERHEAGRIDRQLFGRAARQGDPGSAAAVLSAEDELLRRHAPRWAHRWLALRSRLSARPGRLTRRIVRAAQRRAERCAAAQRRAVLQADDWLDEQLGFTGDRT